jgi:phage terminase small subunit
MTWRRTPQVVERETAASFLHPKRNKSVPPKKRVRKLTAQQAAFVGYYLVHLNAAEAARRAGYSPKHADIIGSRVLRNPLVRAALAKRQAAQLQRVELSADRVLEELRRVAFSDIVDIFDEAGHLRAVHELSPEARATIASIKVTKTNLTSGDGMEDVVEVKRWDKLKALEVLAKHFRLLEPEGRPIMVEKLVLEIQNAPPKALPSAPPVTIDVPRIHTRR